MPQYSYANEFDSDSDQTPCNDDEELHVRGRPRRGRWLCLGFFVVIVIVVVINKMSAGGSGSYNSSGPSSTQANISGRIADTTGSFTPCSDLSSCLDTIDRFLGSVERQKFPGGANLLQTFGPNPQGGGPCGELCKLAVPCPEYGETRKCRYDTYDNALAAIYFTKRGKLTEAKRILDAFIQLLYPDKEIPGVTFGPDDGLPSGRKLTLLTASFKDDAVNAQKPAQAGQYWGESVADGAVDTGNNAWAAMAFAHYAAASQSKCYTLVAHDILQALKSRAVCQDSLGGFMGRLAPYPRYFRASEHNIDMYALATMLGDREAQEQAGNFIEHMYGFWPAYKNSYATGTKGDEICDRAPANGPLPADVQFWNMLSQADDVMQRKLSSLEHALGRSTNDPLSGLVTEDVDYLGNLAEKGVHKRYTGIRFGSWGHGVQWENTAGAVMGMIDYRLRFGSRSPMSSVRINDLVNSMRSSLRSLLAEYGSVLASVRGGNIAAYQRNEPTRTYPGGSDTGMGWTYLRYPHTAATAWTGLLFLYQFDDRKPVNPNANPFAPPDPPVPSVSSPEDTTCLPAEHESIPNVPRSPVGNDEASCSAHDECAGLAGLCCPTESGMYLGCCSSGQGSRSHFKPKTPTASSGSSAACSAHTTCPGLAGNCCPTEEGVCLGCCSSCGA